MTGSPLQFPFLPRPNGNGPLDLVPLLPASLSRSGVTVPVLGLVDSGASMNVVPYDLGVQFGLSWAKLPITVLLGGSAGRVLAKLLPLDVTIGHCFQSRYHSRGRNRMRSQLSSVK